MSTATGGAIGNTTAALVSPAGPVRSAAGRFGVYGGRCAGDADGCARGVGGGLCRGAEG